MFHNLQFLRTLPLPSVRTILSLYLLIDLVPNCLPNEYLTEMSRTCYFESRAFIKHSWTTLLISVLIIFANQISKQYEHVVNSTVMTVFYLKGSCLKDNHLENSPPFFFVLHLPYAREWELVLTKLYFSSRYGSRLLHSCMKWNDFKYTWVGQQ